MNVVINEYELFVCVFSNNPLSSHRNNIQNI